MNWAALAAVASICGLVLTLGVGVFVYGRLTQKVEDHDTSIRAGGMRLDGHDLRLNGHDVSIGRLQEWKEQMEGRGRE